MSQNNSNMKKAKVKKAAAKTGSVLPVKYTMPKSGPEYMVQLSDPPMIRKDILETLREIIMFMQGFERFRMVQQEKMSAIHKLKTDVKRLNTLVDTKLRRHLPKGKVQAHSLKAEESQKVEEMDQPQPLPVKHSELEELESQLKDIENQLRGMG